MKNSMGETAPSGNDKPDRKEEAARILKEFESKDGVINIDLAVKHGKERTDSPFRSCLTLDGTDAALDCNRQQIRTFIRSIKFDSNPNIKAFLHSKRLGGFYSVERVHTDELLKKEAEDAMKREYQAFGIRDQNYSALFGFLYYDKKPKNEVDGILDQSAGNYGIYGRQPDQSTPVHTGSANPNPFEQRQEYQKSSSGNSSQKQQPRASRTPAEIAASSLRTELESLIGRISLQAGVYPLLKPIVAGLQKVVPLFDAILKVKPKTKPVGTGEASAYTA
jgi:hypothetical protein